MLIDLSDLYKKTSSKRIVVPKVPVGWKGLNIYTIVPTFLEVVSLLQACADIQATYNLLTYVPMPAPQIH